MTTLTATSSDAEALRVLIDRQMLEYRTAMPCIVTAVDADGRTVDVQPAVAMTRRNAEGAVSAVAMPIIRGVPIHILGSTALGLFVCVPITPGDDGLLVISDRALDSWQGGSGVAQAPSQASPRHHDATDAIYIPGLQRASSVIPSYPTDAVEVRSRDGTCKLSVRANAISMAVPGGGALALSGNTLAVTGNITATGDITAGTISLQTHTHSGVEPGVGNTAGPNP